MGRLRATVRRPQAEFDSRLEDDVALSTLHKETEPGNLPTTSLLERMERRITLTPERKGHQRSSTSSAADPTLSSPIPFTPFEMMEGKRKLANNSATTCEQTPPKRAKETPALTVERGITLDSPDVQQATVRQQDPMHAEKRSPRLENLARKTTASTDNGNESAPHVTTTASVQQSQPLPTRTPTAKVPVTPVRETSALSKVQSRGALSLTQVDDAQGALASSVRVDSLRDQARASGVSQTSPTNDAPPQKVEQNKGEKNCTRQPDTTSLLNEIVLGRENTAFSDSVGSPTDDRREEIAEMVIREEKKRAFLVLVGNYYDARGRTVDAQRMAEEKIRTCLQKERSFKEWKNLESATSLATKKGKNPTNGTSALLLAPPSVIRIKDDEPL
ncbi:hypothetical protein CBS101457_005915 [Exobasidium rhododendri]|nr:hypothetical protein CBS101457_005915 [Exobasidium rhododendri]